MSFRSPDVPASLVTDDWRLKCDIYRDPGVFEREMTDIYEHCWIFVAHDSEIPAPGDYKRTTIGVQPVIVTRDADDSERVNVMFNRCRHRGSAVCQRDLGNANFFRCSYHGWTYGSDGHLIGVPFADRYGDEFDKSKLGLVHVPRVESYRGFIFANLDPDASSLEEYLGPAAAYIDYVADLDPEGVQFTAGRQQYKFDANWKFQVENTIDMYHVSFTHKSWLDILSAKAGQRVPFVKNAQSSPDWRTIAFPNGHAVHEYKSIEPPASEAEAGLQDGGHSVGIGELLPFNFVIFPNLGFVGAQMRVIVPIAYDRTRVDLYPLVLPSDAAASLQALRDHEAFYGPAGFGTTDDLEVAFERVNRGLSATATSQDWVLIARGAGREELRSDGARIGRPTDELAQRSFYGRWRELLEAGEQHAR